MSQPRIVPLSKTRHAALTFSPLVDYSFTAAMNSMPLLGFEVVEASRCFAIAFPAAGSAVPHALLGLGGQGLGHTRIHFTGERLYLTLWEDGTVTVSQEDA